MRAPYSGSRDGARFLGASLRGKSRAQEWAVRVWRLARYFRTVDAGQGIALQGNDGFRLGLHGRPCARKLGGDALALPPIQAPRHEDAGAGSKQDEELRHG